MKKIAILSDIHGNAQALEAVLHDISKEQVNHIIIAGDHIGDGPEPNRVLKIIKNLSNTSIIKGNKEEYILKLNNGLNQNWYDYNQFASIIWTYKNISIENLQFISEMKSETTLQIMNKIKVRAVHGSPNKPNGIIDTNEELVKIISDLQEDVLIYGHTHNSNFITMNNKFGINPGSVGLPLYKNSFAEYGILEIERNKIVWKQKSIDYNKKEYVNKMEENGLLAASPIWSNAIIDSIFFGENVSLTFIHKAYKILKERDIESQFIPNDVWNELGKNWNWKHNKIRITTSST